MSPPSSPIIPAMPTLKWLGKDFRIIANEKPVPDTSYVFLEGTRYPHDAELPRQFDVLKAYAPIVRQFRTSVLRRPELSPFDHVDVDPIPTRPGEVRSRPYGLPTKRRLTAPVRLLFQDGTNNRSPELRVKGHTIQVESFQLGTVGVDSSGNPQVGLPTWTFHAPADDPSLSLSVLAPWMWEGDAYGLTFAEYIHNIAEEQASDANGSDQPPLEPDVAAVERDLVAYLKNYLPSDSPGWDVSFERSELVVEPGSSETVILRVNAETPGQTVFAVVATPDGNPEEAAVSDLYVLEVRAPDVFEIRDSL